MKKRLGNAKNNKIYLGTHCFDDDVKIYKQRRSGVDEKYWKR
jgi:hypothetical protein